MDIGHTARSGLHRGKIWTVRSILNLWQLAESGTYHLATVISLLTGMTLTEYIRQRRLTLAASDLLRGMRVIDTAVKYGYDSQDGFARAFVRFLASCPRESRDHAARLNVLASARKPDAERWNYDGVQN